MSVIYHIATRGDWERARRSGEYTTSTVGRTLAEEGFIHASGQGQVNGVANRYYRDVPDELLVLVIDTERVRAESGTRTWPAPTRRSRTSTDR